MEHLNWAVPITIVLTLAFLFFLIGLLVTRDERKTREASQLRARQIQFDIDLKASLDQVGSIVPIPKSTTTKVIDDAVRDILYGPNAPEYYCMDLTHDFPACIKDRFRHYKQHPSCEANWLHRHQS